jgi:hypothetical protein
MIAPLLFGGAAAIVMLLMAAIFAIANKRE